MPTIKRKKNLSKKKIRSKDKKSLKKNRTTKLKGGVFKNQISNYDDNMLNRKFNCRQPFWEASCI